MPVLGGPLRRLTLAAATIALSGAVPLAAQQAGGAAAPPAPVAPVLTPASPAPPAPATRAVPVPPAGAVAECRDGSFAVPPETPKACDARGGVRILLPGPRATPAPPSGAARADARVTALAPSAPPAGATMQCKDGTWLTGARDAARCAANGGLGVMLPERTPAPARPPD